MAVQHPSQLIVTLDAKALIGRIVRADGSKTVLRSTEEGGFADPDVVMRTERYSWCPLFDQLTFCLRDQSFELEPSDDRFAQWFMYADFSSLRNEMSQDDFLASAYGRAMECLIEEGFSIEDAQGRSWHYAVFDMSASNARHSIVSFLADRGYDRRGQELRIYDELRRRLDLDIDFPKLKRERPKSIFWNKFFAYRGLYLTTAQRVPVSADFALSKDTVLVIDANEAGGMFLPCDVRRVRAASADRKGNVRAEFYMVGAEDGGGVVLRRFDGEGLISPDYAAYVRSEIFDNGKRGSQPSSFQIRMPFAKGVVHEVDFHRFVAEALAADDEHFANLYVEDAYGVPRRLAEVKLIITTDMLKCHRWLIEWLALSAECEVAYALQDIADPMAFYFAEMGKYDHALYVLPRKRRIGNAYEIMTNYQHLSTLLMASDEFDGFMGKRFRAMGDVLFDLEKARKILLDSGDDGSDDDSGDDGRTERPCHACEYDAALYALSTDARYIYDPYIQKRVFDAVNARLIDYAVGKVPVKGTLRLLSQDLLSFLCFLAERARSADSDEEGSDAVCSVGCIDNVKAECLDPQAIYLPHFDETGWLAVFRNPHMSRSEQCALRSVQPDPNSYRARYLGHLDDVAMVSCDSTAPMVLGGADYDGDTVHVYAEAAMVDAVLRGAYADPDADVLVRRFPIADLSGDEETADREGASSPDESIGRHIAASQLLKSFRSNVGILSNSAFRLGTVLYGEHEGSALKEEYSSDDLTEDACANYTIAVGADIDSVKTGFRLDTQDLLVTPNRKRVSLFGVSGKIVPRKLDLIHFVKNVARELKQSNVPLWAYERIDASRPGKIDIYLGPEDTAAFATLDLGASLAQNSVLQDVSVSNVQRLPWLMMAEARRIHAEMGSTDFIGNRGAEATSPLEDLHRMMEIVVDQAKLDAIESLVRAYQAAMWRLRIRDQKANAAKRSKAFGKARRRAQEYPTGFIEAEIDAILSRAILDIRDYIALEESPSFSDVLLAFKEKGFVEWALQPAGKRREALQRFLPGLVFADDFYAILENDALVNGFMIPFYLVGAAQAAEDADAMLGQQASSSSAEGEKKLEKISDYVPKDPQMYAELIALIDEHLRKKSSRSVLTEKLVAALKDRIVDVLSEDDRLLEYLCVLKFKGRCFSDKHHDTRALFWSLLTPEDLKEVLG